MFQLHNIIDYDKFNECSITHHSTAIEGSTLTENETRLLLDEGITPKGKPLTHSLMVKDHILHCNSFCKKQEKMLH